MTPLSAATGLDELGAERFLTALVRSSDDAIIGKTPDGRVVFWNAAAERLYGYEAAEMLGRDIAILFPPDHAHELSEIMEQVKAGKVVRDLRTKRVRKNGAVVPVSITVSPVIDADGTVIGASSVAHDLSQYVEHVRVLRQAERRAAEALSTLDTLHASAPIGLGFVDREFRFVHLNDMLAAFSGCQAQDKIGMTVAEVVPDIWPRSSPCTAGYLTMMKPSSTSR